jgi:hypothetical protein
MKIVNYKRVEKPGAKTLCIMDFVKGPAVILDFGKKDGGKLKLGTDFIADAIEHYLTYAIKRGLKEHAAQKRIK